LNQSADAGHWPRFMFLRDWLERRLPGCAVQAMGEEN